MSFSCNKYNESFIARYLDNNVTDKERENFEKHIKTCDICLTYLLETKKNIMLMEQSKPREVPAHLLSAIYNKDKGIGLGRIVFKWFEEKLELLSQSLKGINLMPDTVAIKSKNQILKRYFIQHVDFSIMISPQNKNTIALEIHFKDVFYDEYFEIYKQVGDKSELILAIKADKDYFTSGDLLIGNYEIRFKNQSIFIDVS